MKNVNAITAIAARDFTKFIRDRTRLLATFVFPFLFIGILGSSLQSNLAADAGYNFMAFIFTGVLGQVMFQSTAAGIISLIEDRKNDFSQELFVSPVSRYIIILGKIVGELSISLAQAMGVLFFGLIVGVPLTISQLIMISPALIVGGLLGGAFGVLVLANFPSERSANQLFPFVIFPQYFLAGVFSPVKNLPFLLDILSKISPMRYAVDLVRSLYYTGAPEAAKIVLASTLTNLITIFILFIIFLTLGTTIFVKNERNR